MRSAVFIGAALVALSINPTIFTIYDPDFKYITFIIILFGFLDLVDFLKNLNT